MLILRPEALEGQGSRNAQLAHVAAGNLTTSPGVKGMIAPPGHRSSWRSQSSWKALLGKYGPCRTGHALQKMVNVSLRCCTSCNRSGCENLSLVVTSLSAVP